MTALRLALLVVLVLVSTSHGANEGSFPTDAGVRDVRTEFGAKGDGVSDDTAAIQRAFEKCQQKHMEIVYFPNGTYLVSKPVYFRGWMFVQGESRDKTIIKLDGTSTIPGTERPRNTAPKTDSCICM